MIALSTFRPTVLPFVHDCPDIAADVAVRFALREFCNKSDWLRFEHDPISPLVGVADYDFSPPDLMNVVRILEATYDGRRITAKTTDELRSRFEDWRGLVGKPSYVTQLTPDTLRLVPTPDEHINAALKLICSLEPVVDATTVDDTLYARWSETIGYGARARLKMMSGQPYYDPQGAVYDRAMFNAGVNEAKAEALKSMQRAVQHVQMRRW